MTNISVNGAGMHEPPKIEQQDLNGIDSTARRVQSKKTRRKSSRNKGRKNDKEEEEEEDVVENSRFKVMQEAVNK